MKILINALSARLGGGQTYLTNLLAHLPDRDDLEVLIYAPGSLQLPDSAKIKRCAFNFQTENPIVRALWERFVLPHVLRKHSVDILFCPGGTINTLAPEHCKTVTMFRNMIPFDMQIRRRLPLGLQRVRNWLLERIMLKSMAAADLTIFISDYARSVIEQRIRPKNAITIPHGINPAFRTYGSVQERSDAIPAGKFILYVSRFDVYKHHYEIVEAYARLPEQLRSEYQLVFVGEAEGGEAARVFDLIEQNGLNDAVSVVGAVPYVELPVLYHHAALILFASSCENCPNILLEALGAGRPILSSNVMPMPEFGGEGVGYFSPYDPQDLAEKMREVLTKPQLAEAMSVAAAARSENFHWTRSAERTWEALLRLVDVERELGD